MFNEATFNPDDKDETESIAVLGELENIDDECDQKGITFVKIDNPDEAKEYGIDVIPTLVYFENKIPSVYNGNHSILLRKFFVLVSDRSMNLMTSRGSESRRSRARMVVSPSRKRRNRRCHR